MANFNPGSKRPIHPQDRFSAIELGLEVAEVEAYDSLSPDETDRVLGEAMVELLHGSPTGIHRVAAIDNLHVLASKMGFELIPVERPSDG